MAQDSRQSDEPEQEPKRGDDHRSSTTERGLVGSLLPSTGDGAGHLTVSEAEAAPIPAQFQGTGFALRKSFEKNNLVLR